MIRREGYDCSKIEIVCVQGVNNLSHVLRALVTEPEWTKLLSATVILDADDDPKGRSDSIRDAFRDRAGLSPRAAREGKQKGFVAENGIRYAAWLAPGNGRRGQIEDLVCETIDQRVREHICDLWRSVHGDEGERPSSKAEVAIFIALCANRGL
ncbi:MAG: hypothetical protein NZ555_16985, partial [Geminicoccaceae bacterium]|nr:hypothetical protein [Geminicoccaceae bacterium]